jgi:hypothetical protein
MMSGCRFVLNAIVNLLSERTGNFLSNCFYSGSPFEDIIVLFVKEDIISGTRRNSNN